MSAAKITQDGKTTRLVLRAGAPETITEHDVQDPSNLALILTGIRADVADQRADFVPNRIDYEDYPVLTGGAALRLIHGFNGRVRWWVVGWQCPTNVAPILKEDTVQTDTKTLVLLSYVAGTVTIRVEAAG